MAVLITLDDLRVPTLGRPDFPAELAVLMIAEAQALAAGVAPCLNSATFAGTVGAKSVLRSAIVRWYDRLQEGDSPPVRQATIGSASYTLETPADARELFRAGELAQLRALCGAASRVYTVSLAGA